jgi:hypothetical protein
MVFFLYLWFFKNSFSLNCKGYFAKVCKGQIKTNWGNLVENRYGLRLNFVPQNSDLECLFWSVYKFSILKVNLDWLVVSDVITSKCCSPQFSQVNLILLGDTRSTLKKVCSHIEHFGSLLKSSVFEVGNYLTSPIFLNLFLTSVKS